MPRLACRSCGRQIYATAPLESLFAEERRCPRCGASLNNDRRDAERRLLARRQNSAEEPGPPATGEQRTEERRKGPRRKDGPKNSKPGGDRAGWID